MYTPNAKTCVRARVWLAARVWYNWSLSDMTLGETSCYSVCGILTLLSGLPNSSLPKAVPVMGALQDDCVKIRPKEERSYSRESFSFVRVWPRIREAGRLLTTFLHHFRAHFENNSKFSLDRPHTLHIDSRTHRSFSRSMCNPRSWLVSGIYYGLILLTFRSSGYSMNLVTSTILPLHAKF
jgi:hypothetical protein